jgi:amino acid transporter
VRALSRAISSPPAVSGLPERSPMSGLERRSLRSVDVLAQSVAAIAPTAAAATLPAFIGAQSGGSAFVCLLFAWLLVAGVVHVVGQFTRRVAAPGSLYSFTTMGLGPTVGFASAIALVCGYALVTMFALIGAASSATTLLRSLLGDLVSSDWATPAGVVAFAAVTLAVLRGGIRISARVTLVIEAVSLVLLMSVLGLVLASTDQSALTAPLGLGMPGLDELAAGTAVAMTAFVGFESVASLGREARRPFVTIPRTMRLSVIAVGLLYLGSAYTQKVGETAFHVGPHDNGEAVARLTSHTELPWLGHLIEIGQTTSFVACAIASLTALSRVVLTLGREGVLPATLGNTHPSKHTPHRAFLLAMPVVGAVPVILLVLTPWTPWRTMSILLAVSAIGFLGSYVCLCAAAPAFLWRIGEFTWSVAVVGYGVGAVLLAGLVVFVRVVADEQKPALWMVTGLALAGVAGYACVRQWRPGAIGVMGLFDQPTSDDVLSEAGHSPGAV